MSRWKAPENFGTGCSIGGRWLEVIDGILNVEDIEGVDYQTPLTSLGFVQLPEDDPIQSLPGAQEKDQSAEAGQGLSRDDSSVPAHSSEALHGSSGSSQTAARKSKVRKA
jgi:hypothetical protein